MPKNSIARWLWVSLALIVGILGMSAVWVAVAVISNRPSGWLALLAAVDMALLLRLTRAPRGLFRILAGVLATALTVVLSQWLVVATHLGALFGLEPLASAQRLGPVLAWELSKLNLQRADWAFILLSLLFAAWLARGGKNPNG